MIGVCLFAWDCFEPASCLQFLLEALMCYGVWKALVAVVPPPCCVLGALLIMCGGWGSGEGGVCAWSDGAFAGARALGAVRGEFPGLRASELLKSTPSAQLRLPAVGVLPTVAAVVADARHTLCRCIALRIPGFGGASLYTIMALDRSSAGGRVAWGEGGLVFGLSCLLVCVHLFSFPSFWPCSFSTFALHDT